ncbi:MAG: hypothetical protein ACHQ2Z_08660 [Elusimicrobiota bacterium]
MRIFPPAIEEQAFRHGVLKEWRDARLVGAEAAVKIAAAIGEPPADAAWPLRFVLFGFASLCQGAAYALVFKDIHDRAVEGVAALIAAATSIAIAEAIIRGLRVRRHGAEEALVAGAVIMAAFAAERFLGGGIIGDSPIRIVSIALAGGAALAYARYGYRLAAIGAAAGLGGFFGTFDIGERGTRVVLAGLYAVLLAAVSFARSLPRRERERLEILRFFLALSVPLCLNLALDRLGGGLLGEEARSVAMDGFAWATFAAIFLIPSCWLAWGISSRSRPLVWAGGLGFLLAFCSIKPYFGWARHSWDPAVLGVELIVLALALKRWLDSGPGRRRGGFSSEEMGNSEPGGALGLLAGAIAAGPAAAPRGPDAMRGHGGDFGGGGASGSY